MGEGNHTSTPAKGGFSREDGFGLRLRIRNLLDSCSGLFNKFAPMTVLGSPTIEYKRGLVNQQSLNVLRQRIFFWGETVSDLEDPVQYLCFDPKLTLSTLDQLDEALHNLLQNSEEVSKEHIVLVDSLYTQLPPIWRDSTEMALTATLVGTTITTMLKEELKPSSNSDLHVFTASLGSSKVEKDFWMMRELMDEKKPSSLPLLTADDLVPPKSEDSYDGIEIYSQMSGKDRPASVRLISVHTEWTVDQVRSPSEDMERIRDGYRKRLLLRKPDEMRVLAFAGHLRNSATGGVELMYHFPHWASQDSAPMSLHRLIAEKRLPDDKEVRYSIARKLVCAILYFDACQWIHGNIDARNIIFFKNSEHNLNFDEPFFSKFIPSFNGGQNVIPDARSADAILGGSERLRNEDAYSLWRIVELVIREREIASTKSHSESYSKDYGTTLEISRCFESDQFIPGWTKGVDTSYIRSNGKEISRPVFYRKLIRILNHYLYGISEPIQQSHTLQGLYSGPQPELPCIGVSRRRASDRTATLQTEDKNKEKSFEMAKFAGTYKDGTQGVNTSSLELSDKAADFVSEPENRRTYDEKSISSNTKQIFPVNATPDQLTTWRTNILPRLERILERHLGESEPFSIDLLGIGISRKDSQRTIVVTCTSTKSVKEILKKFNYNRTWFRLKVRRGSVKRSCDGGTPGQGSRHQERPLPGASIGAVVDGESMPAATYGGLILVDEKPYALTVHHILDPEEPTEEQAEDRTGDQEEYRLGPEGGCGALAGDYEDLYMSSGNSTSEEVGNGWYLVSGGASDEGNHMTCTYRSHTTLPHQYQELEEDNTGSDVEFGSPASSLAGTCGSPGSGSEEGYFNDTETEFCLSRKEYGDIPGIEKDHGRNIVIIQPAEQDLLKAERRDDIVGQYKLGTVHASSGIRRVMHDSRNYEIDWALIEMSAKRLGHSNTILGSGRILGPPMQDSEPDSFVLMDNLGNLKVHGIGRTSGLQEGIINGAISSVRVHGRKTAAYTWVVLGGIGAPGDSGAWIIDNDRGGVCGHIFAADEERSPEGQIRAYMNPMELLLQDIEGSLKAKNVCLPLPNDAADLAENMVESLLVEGGSSASDISMLPTPSALDVRVGDSVHFLA